MFFLNEKHHRDESWVDLFLWTPPSSTRLSRQWSIVSTSAHNLKHQISPPVEGTFDFIQRGPTFRALDIKCADVQYGWVICPAYGTAHRPSVS